MENTIITSSIKKSAIDFGTQRLWNARLFIYHSGEKFILGKYQPKNGDPNLYFGSPINSSLLLSDGKRGVMKGQLQALIGMALGSYADMLLGQMCRAKQVLKRILNLPSG